MSAAKDKNAGANKLAERVKYGERNIVQSEVLGHEN